MTVADITIILIVVISLLLGLWRGLVKEALSLASWVAAVLLAGFFGGPLADLMVNVLDNATVRRILASAVIFVFVMFVGTILGNIMSRLSTAIGLRGVDRVLGSVFGVLRGVIIVLLVLFLTSPFEFSVAWYQDSFLVPYFMVLLENIEGVLATPAPQEAIAALLTRPLNSSS